MLDDRSCTQDVLLLFFVQLTVRQETYFDVRPAADVLEEPSIGQSKDLNLKKKGCKGGLKGCKGSLFQTHKQHSDTDKR